MKVYDCFPFCWELELLEIRLKTLGDIVDYFVIAESPYLRSGERKPLYYYNVRDKEPFASFKSKIIHLIETRPPSSDRQEMEWRQKNKISDGLTTCHPNDLVFISDADEIWNPAILPQVTKLTLSKPCYLDHQLHYYFFNCLITNSSKYSSNVAFACRYHNLTTVKQMRRKWNSFTRIKPSGWHYAYLMSPEGISDKIRALGVAKYRAAKYQDLSHIKSCMLGPSDLYDRKDLYTFAIVPPAQMDAPDCVKANLSRYKSHIYPGD